MSELPESLDELLRDRPKEIRAILKRDGKTIESFNREAIINAVQKASFAAGRNYSRETAERITEQIERELGEVLSSKGFFTYSGGNIPHTEDVQEAVVNHLNKENARKAAEIISRKFNVPEQDVQKAFFEFIKKDFDPTGIFYEVYKERRNQVRERIVNLPFSVEFDSTDKQLQIHSIDEGKACNFEEDTLLRLILENTGADYESAKSAVKRVEEFLTLREVGNIGKEEITAIIDAALMEKGIPYEKVLGGKRVSITFDDIEQLIFNRSQENSNIKCNNPEAVNLGIAELALKEFSPRKVFRKEVAEAHKNGVIHIHDLGYTTRVYCSAHSIEYLKKYGLDKIVATLDSKSFPAKSPQVLNNHVHTFLASIQTAYAGALGFPMLNSLYAPGLLKEVEMVEVVEKIKDEKGKVIARKKRRLKRETLEELAKENPEDYEEVNSTRILQGYSKKELKQIAQNLVFGSSQSAFSRGGQTLFIDFNIDLGVPPHLRNVPALFLGAKYKKIKQNEFGEWEVVEVSEKEPERYEGLMKDKGHKDENGNPILEPDEKNGDVIQPENPEEGIWATYGHELVKKASLDFAEVLIEMSAEGDRYKDMFNFPKMDVHVSRETYEDPEAERVLRKACEVVEKNDSIYFLFDRGDGMNVAQCCRLRERITDPGILKHPEKMRFCGFQNVTINIPQASYRAKGETLEEKLDSTLKEIEKSMTLALKAHADKRKFIQTLFDKKDSALYFMGGMPSDDGEPYIDLSKSTYIIGVLGLNEAVQHLTGKELHESPEAYEIGLKILSRMYSIKEEFSKRFKMKFVLEETPGESANRRLAKIDLYKYPEKAKKVVKGSIEEDSVYYTNSAHLSAEASVSGLDRIILQSKMNPMIEAGAITHIFSGEKVNKAKAVYDIVKATYENTQSSQIVFSGEHTVCLECGNHERGLKDSCKKCGNENPDRIIQKTRVVGYFSDPRTWNKSKREGELKARQKTSEFYAGLKESTYDLEAELFKRLSKGNGEIKAIVIGTEKCPVCTQVVEKIKRALRKIPFNDRVKIEKYDVATEEGRTIAAIYDAPIDTYPSIIIHKGDRVIRKSWEYPYNEPARGVSIPEIREMFLEIEK